MHVFVQCSEESELLNNNGIKNVEDLRIESHIVAKLCFVNSTFPSFSVFLSLKSNSGLSYFISGTERHRETVVTLFVNIYYIVYFLYWLPYSLLVIWLYKITTIMWQLAQTWYLWKIPLSLEHSSASVKISHHHFDSCL